MKSRILSFITLIVVLSGLTKTTQAANTNAADFTLLNDISAINKIEVYGNVEVYVSNATTDQVKVYNKYYTESALVQSKNGVLRITSYKNEKLIVWVSANDLRAISAYDNAEIKSFGKLSNIDLAVDLHNNATAQLAIDAYTASVTIKDNAKAELSGSANEFTLNNAGTANIINKNFVAAHYTEYKPTIMAQIQNDDEMGL